MSIEKIKLTKVKDDKGHNNCTNEKRVSGGMVLILLCAVAVFGATLTGLGSDINSNALMDGGIALMISGGVFCIPVGCHYFG